MARFRPADRRFCHHWCFVIRQSELDADAFAGRERNLCAQSHTPSADIYAVAPNFLPAFPSDDNRVDARQARDEAARLRGQNEAMQSHQAELMRAITAKDTR